MDTKIIELKDVEFSYSKRTKLLSGVNLEIKAGHIHGLLGKNGEGKSTLLKLISGLIFPKKGDITTLGTNPKYRNPEMLEDIFFLPEEFPLILITIEEFQKVYAPFYPKFNSAQFDSYLAEFDIVSKKATMSKLSLGQKKKVLIAFGLATNTKLLLMDEPTNGLDIPSKGQFRRMVAASMNEERCLLISTHQVRDLELLIDGIIIMEGHEIIFNQPVDIIAEKLHFGISVNDESEDHVIYSEKTLQGNNRVRINTSGIESNVDIELLFNAVLSQKQKIKQLFQ